MNTTQLTVTNEPHDICIELPGGKTLRVALRQGRNTTLECADVSLESPDQPDGQAGDAMHKAIVFGLGTQLFHSRDRNAVFSTILLNDQYYTEGN